MSKNKSYNDLSMWKGATPDVFLKARILRNNMTQTELLLWEEIKGNKLLGYKFRRQHPIASFIADFYCHKLNLIIEIDGEYHNIESQIKLDDERTEILEFQGVEVLRFTNNEVLKNMPEVLEKIKSFIKTHTIK